MATALYRRYRPESFAEVIGQDHVTTPLQRALRAGRIGHAYLFSGPRGCGKTTSARILARCLNCEQGPTDAPCGQCDSCRDLARGGAGSLDVVEIDAASHGGVDDARELRERASFAPVRDRYKVFVIDEAHMVTSAGFNALLKLVEEPPEHVKFVFATTEPDKVIGTIRSRTHHYPFRLIPPQILTPYLEEVSAAESVNVGQGVLPLVVRAGGGSARDSMSVLDQLMAGAGEDGVDFQTAIALLGFTDTALLDRAVGAIAQRDAATLYDAVEQVLATGHEPRRFVEDLLERVRDLIVLSAVPDRGADLLPQVPADELEAMRAQAGLFAPADLSRCGDLTFETLSTMSGATSPRLHLELLAARLVLRDELAAGAAPAPEGAGAGQPAPAGRQAGPGAGSGGQAQGGGPSGREQARRIAQEKVDAARQARGEVHPPQGPSREQAPRDQGPPQEQAPRRAVPEQAGPEQPAPPRADDGWGQVAVPGQGAASAGPQHGHGQQPAAANGQQPAAPTGEQAPPEPGTGQEQSATAGPSAPAAPSAGPDAEAVRGHWSAILDELSQIRRPSWALISQNAHVLDLRGSTLVLGFRTEGLVSAFHRGTAAENLADAVRRIMRLDVAVEAVVGEDPGSGGQTGPGPGGAGPGGPGSRGQEPGGPATGGPGGPGAGSSGAGGPGGRGSGGPGGPGPGGPGGPGAGPARAGAGGSGAGAESGEDPQGGPQAARPTSPSRGPDAWGDAASSMTSAPDGAAAAPRTASAGTGAGRGTGDFPPEPDDDPFPPEPEDAYPPDPRDEPGPTADATRAPQRGRRWSESLAPADAAPVAPTRLGGSTGSAADVGAAGSAAPTSAAPASAGPAPDTGPPAASTDQPGDAPVVEDEGRDSLPEDQPRTYGQAALKQALAEGRVVRSRPAAHVSSATEAAHGAETVPSAAETAPSAARPWSEALAGPATDDPATSDPTAAPEPPSRTPSAAPEPPTPTPSAAPASSANAPSASAPPRTAPEPAAPAAARSGIALAREAAMASRTGGLRGGRPAGPARPDPDADPTGGASRDDEDAVVATRNGREVIEKLLGGTVLEVIDETQNR